MAKKTKVNPHAGSSFDDYLKEDGIFEEVQSRALERALAEQLDESLVSAKLFAQRAALVNAGNTQLRDGLDDNFNHGQTATSSISRRFG